MSNGVALMQFPQLGQWANDILKLIYIFFLMASRGDLETVKLKKNVPLTFKSLFLNLNHFPQVEDQLNRLLTQLQDLEEMKAELDPEEYESSRQETLDQLKGERKICFLNIPRLTLFCCKQEFETALGKMVAGNMTLVDELGSIQLAIQAAIRSAFKSPEVIRMFAKRENGALRSRLDFLRSELRLNRISPSDFNELAFEIVTALEKLGEVLPTADREFLEQASFDDKLTEQI